MIIGALVDIGVTIDELNNALDALGVKGIYVTREITKRGGVTGTLVSVQLERKQARSKSWQDFVKIVEDSDLTDNVVKRSCEVFHRLAKAEAIAHGTSVQKSELHELGEMDTLVDVVCSIVGLETLGVEKVYSSAFPSGSGVIESSHGILPVPAPATAALFTMARAPVVPSPAGTNDTGEMVTPTGAAIITTVAKFCEPSMNITRVGYGLGSRESRYYPNVLALRIGEEIKSVYHSDLIMIETNIDDMAGEFLGYVHERLFELGARDVWFTPIQMKKNRPAFMMSAIIPSDLKTQAIRLIMRETSTLGVRVKPLERCEAQRENAQIDTSLGPIQVKVKRLDGEILGVSPEYESCRRLALKCDLPLQEIYRIVQREVGDNLLKN